MYLTRLRESSKLSHSTLLLVESCVIGDAEELRIVRMRRPMKLVLMGPIDSTFRKLFDAYARPDPPMVQFKCDVLDWILRYLVRGWCREGTHATPTTGRCEAFQTVLGGVNLEDLTLDSETAEVVRMA